MEVQYFHKRCSARISALYDNEEVGYLTYTIEDGTMDIEHTVVKPEMRGQGIARRMVEMADAFCKREGLEIKASCSYAAEVLGLDNPNPSCKI